MSPNATITKANIYMTVAGGASGTEQFVEQISVSSLATTAYSRSTDFIPLGVLPTFAYRGHAWVLDNSSEILLAGCTSNSLPSTDCRHVVYANGTSDVTLIGFRVLTGGTIPTYDMESVPLATSSARLSFFGISSASTALNCNLTFFSGSDGTIIAKDGVNLGIGTATPQTLLDVAGQARVKPVAFSALPAASGALEGTVAAVTDSTTAVWGATITGGGANHVLAWCNGSAWKVIAT